MSEHRDLLARPPKCPAGITVQGRVFEDPFDVPASYGGRLTLDPSRPATRVEFV